MGFLRGRRERQEIERKMKARQGRRSIERHIRRQRQNVQRYWELAKRAARLRDQKMFKQIAAFILATQRDITQWERRLLYFDMVQARRDQVLTSAQFAEAYQAMAQSMLAHSSPENLARIQQDIERGFQTAEMMDEMLENLMDISEDLLEDVMSADQEGELRQIMEAIEAEAEQEAQGVEDAEIEAALRAIEEQLTRR